MAKIPGTAVASPIVPLDSELPTPTHTDIYGKGGWVGVASLAERNAIPMERRKPGMIASVSNSTGSTPWELVNDLVTWIPFKPPSLPNAELFTSPSQGIAGTDPDDWFYVADETGRSLYRNVAGVATFVILEASAAQLTEATESAAENAALAVAAKEAAEEAANRVDLGALDAAMAATEADAAQTAEDRAQTTEDRVQTGLDRAQTSADVLDTAANAALAEAAAETAAVNADVYTSEAAGLAAVAEGDQFVVVSADGFEFIRYRHDAGPLAVEVGRYPSAEKTKSILNIAPDGYAYAIVDGFGLVAFGIKDDGTTSIASINGKNVDEWLAETVNAGSLVTDTPQGYAFAVLDKYLKAAVGLRDDGTAVVKSLELGTLNGVAVSALIAGSGGGAAKTYRSRFPSEINMLLSYGQSLAVGTDGIPAISLSQRFNNIRMAGGVRTQDSGTPYTGFIPLVEQDAATLGETPISGATDAVIELIASEDGIAFDDHAFQLLGSAPGAGGTAIAGLDTGSAPFNRFVADVQAGYDLSQAEQKSFKVGAFFWTQGESDYINSTPKATYKSLFVALRNDLEVAVQGISGQAEPLACISYQTQGHAIYGFAGNPYIAVAQLEVSRENANHYVACPLYWSTQSVHQSAANYKRLGAYYGLAYKRIVIDGEDWKPVQPEQVDQQGTVIYLRFNVPTGKLVIDNAFRAAQPSSGFSVVDSVGTTVAISSVEITGLDTVKIVTATSATGGRVRYGFGSGGNLRDTQGDTIVFDPAGLNFPLHNWCVIFDEAL